MQKYCLLIILLSTNAFGDFYFVNPSRTVGKKVFDSRLDIRRFTTENLFDTSGEKSPLPDGNSYSTGNIDLNLIYGLSEVLDLNLGLRGRSNHAQVNGQSMSNTGFESFWITLKYLFLDDTKFTSSVEFLFRSTFYSNNNEMVKSQELILGDAGNQEALFLNGGLKFTNKFYLFGRLGMNWPENVLSPEVLYNLKFSWLTKPLRLDLGLDGTISFYKSPYSSLSAARSAFNLNTGGTNLFVSWNRESIIPFAELTYLAGDWNFGLNVNAIVAGKSTDNGVTIGLFFLHHIGAVKKPFKDFDHTYSDFKTLGSVTVLSPPLEHLKIPFGTSVDLEKGTEIYFFKKISSHREILMATGKVVEVGVKWSIIRILEKLNNISLNEELIAKVLYKKN